MPRGDGGRELYVPSPLRTVARVDTTTSAGTARNLPADTAFDTVLVLDYGSQYTPLIARRIREASVYSEIVPWNLSRDRLRELAPKGIVLSGSDASVHDENAPRLPEWLLEEGLPVLGICYGLQLVAHTLGGSVGRDERREYGPAKLEIIEDEHPLFTGCPKSSRVWMSHGDKILKAPAGFRQIARTDGSEAAALSRDDTTLIQFHPEVNHTESGHRILRNFVVDICGCRLDWNAGSFVGGAVGAIRDEVGDAGILLGISGGVDSAVAAALVHAAVGERLHCIFVDTGLLRDNEVTEVEESLRAGTGLNLATVDAADRFLDKLKGVSDPERKREIIGDEFFAVFIEEAAKLDGIEFFVQGTIYPDTIESGSAGLGSAKIKTHHNTRIPDRLHLKVIEPLRRLFKDEVRKVGLELELPESLVWRQPFPGPGLAVRLIGEITRERVAALQAADRIFREEVAAAGLEREISQYFAALTGIRTVGVMGDSRTYGEVAALRAVTTDDFMTADWFRLPDDVLARTSSRIVNEVSAITRVVYDVTSKPPGTIEWE